MNLNREYAGLKANPLPSAILGNKHFPSPLADLSQGGILRETRTSRVDMFMSKLINSLTKEGARADGKANRRLTASHA